MGIFDLVRKRQLLLPTLCIASLYLLVAYLTGLPLPGASYLGISTLQNECANPAFQWRGANDKIWPASGLPVRIKHNDYSDGLINHDVNIYMARSVNEEFSIQVEIHTSHPLPQDNFEISYQHDDLIINSMVPKADPIVNEEITKNEGHCVRIKVSLMIPVSKPLTGLSFDFPKANLYIHDSAWGSLPTLDIDIGEGNIHGGKDQRLHIESTTIRLDRGRIEGKYMLTKNLDIVLREGTIDLKVGYSPYLVGATMNIQQQSGSQKLNLEDLWYRPTTGSFALQRGSIDIHYPKSYNGRVIMEARNGNAKLHGAGIEIIEQSKHGVKPVWIEARQGYGPTYTKIRLDNGNVVMTVDDPDRKKMTITAE